MKGKEILWNTSQKSLNSLFECDNIYVQYAHKNLFKHSPKERIYTWKPAVNAKQIENIPFVSFT